MTVDSLNIEAVSPRTKPIYFNGPSLSQAVLSCPKCNAAMEPMLLNMNDDGTQSVWWTCAEVKTKKCFFPLNMPNDVFWVTRSAQDIEKDEVPPPNLANLPIRYQYLYPSFFQRYTPASRKTPGSSRQGSHDSTRSASIESSHSVTVPDSIWDDGDAAKCRTAVKLNGIAKPRVVMTEKRSYIPSLAAGNRALRFTESYRHDTTASTSIASRFKLGNTNKKMDKAQRELAKKKVIQMLSGVQPAHFFKRMGPLQINEMKKAVIEHVKKRRAEREQLAELKKLNERRNKVIDIDDLVKAKLAKNKREYEQMRLEKAREARMAAARMSKTAMSQPAMPAMPGYEDDGYEEGIHSTETASYAVTPPYMSGSTSPIPSTSSFNQFEGQFPQEYNFGGEDSFVDPCSSSGMDWEMDHSLDIPPYGNDESNVVSPFAELGHLDEDDLMGIEGDQQFDRAFEAVAEAFSNEFEDEFSDLSQYN